MNKKLLPRRWLLLTLALTAAAAAGLLAAPAAAAAGPARDDPAAVATAYLEARAAAVQAARPARVLSPYLEAGTALAVREAAIAHGLALRQADLGHALDAVTCDVSIIACAVDASTGVATVNAHAVTTLRWHGAKGPSTEASGVDHSLRLARTAAGWRLTADRYTDVQVPALLERAGIPRVAVQRAAARLERAALRAPRSAGTAEPPAPPAGAVGRTIPDRIGYSDRIYYDRAGAATAYADRYALSYNPTYARFTADCCNYVSQGAEAGDMPRPSATWHLVVRQGGHDSDRRPLDQELDLVHQEISFWVGRRLGWVSSICGDSKGDFVYYDWTGDGSWDHVAILAGTNSAGQKVIDAHTTDHYHYWKLGPRRRATSSAACARPG